MSRSSAVWWRCQPAWDLACCGEMRTQTGTFTLAACLLAVFSPLSGCAYGEMTQVLRTQVASETDCPETKVSKREIYDGGGANEYVVTGCGESRRYVCPADEGLFNYDEAICTLGAGEGAGDKPKLATVDDDDMLSDTPEIDTSAPEDDEPADEEPADEEPADEEPADEEAVQDSDADEAGGE